jgi:hypothetical protein
MRRRDRRCDAGRDLKARLVNGCSSPAMERWSATSAPARIPWFVCLCQSLERLGERTMATATRRPFHEMDHDQEMLPEEIGYASRTELRGAIPEFLANSPNAPHPDSPPPCAPSRSRGGVRGNYERRCPRRWRRGDLLIRSHRCRAGMHRARLERVSARLRGGGDEA